MRSLLAATVLVAASVLTIEAAEAKCSPHNSVKQRWQPAYVYFETGKATLSPAAKKTIADQAKLAKDNYIQLICLTGTADKKGDPKANTRLSQARANAVVAEFARHGVPRKSLETDAQGEPGGSFLGGVTGGSSAERRVEIQFTR